MATPFDDINAIFYNMIEEDGSFFDYYGIDQEDAELIAQQRADACLTEAAIKLSLRIQADIDFTDFDVCAREFAEDLTKNECYLLASLQYEEYLFRDIAKLRANAMHFTSAEQTVFSPANERKTFMDMYNLIVERNNHLIDRYCSKDRLTGAYQELESETTDTTDTVSAT